MTMPNNPAARLHAVLYRVKTTGGARVQGGWARVFGFPTDHPRLPYEVTRSLSVVLDEIGLLRRMWPAEHVGALDRLEAAIVPENLAATWSPTQAAVAKELEYLQLMAGALPEDEPRVDPAALQELRTEVEAVLSRVETSDLPAKAKSFLLEQLRIILRALVDFEVRGSAAFREASVQAAELWTARREDIAGFEDSEEVHQVQSLWPRIRAVLNDLAIIGTIFTSGVVARELLVGPRDAPISFEVRALPSGTGKRNGGSAPDVCFDVSIDDNAGAPTDSRRAASHADENQPIDGSGVR